MEIKITHIVIVVLGLLVAGSSFFLQESDFFLLVLGLGVIVAASPFIISLIRDSRINAEKEEMFLEFTRNLVESVKAGTPVSKSIVNVKDKPYGMLSHHVKKLANQISLGVPLTSALNTFSHDVNNKTISRAITLINEAERSGGDIGQILEAVAGAVSLSDKLKKERKSAISTLVVQGYIIFVIFLVIVIVMQFRILPLVSGIANVDSSLSSATGTTLGGGAIDEGEIARSFLYLLLIQGLFSGLVIGKLSEESIKAGVKHSFILVIMSFLITSVANILFGS